MSWLRLPQGQNSTLVKLFTDLGLGHWSSCSHFCCLRAGCSIHTSGVWRWLRFPQVWNSALVKLFTDLGLERWLPFSHIRILTLVAISTSSDLSTGEAIHRSGTRSLVTFFTHLPFGAGCIFHKFGTWTLVTLFTRLDLNAGCIFHKFGAWHWSQFPHDFRT